MQGYTNFLFIFGIVLASRGATTALQVQQPWLAPLCEKPRPTDLCLQMEELRVYGVKFLDQLKARRDCLPLSARVSLL